MPGGQLITLLSKVGGTNGKMIRFNDMAGYNSWSLLWSGNYALTSDTITVYNKDLLYTWPYTTYLPIWSIADRYDRWNKNTFYTGSNNSSTFPNGSSLSYYYNNVSWSETNGKYRIVNDGEAEKTRMFKNISGTTMYQCTLTQDFVSDLVNYAPSIFLRFYTISEIYNYGVSNGYGNLKNFLPGFSQVLIFIDRLGTNDSLCQYWPGHTSLSTPLRIPVADFALRWNFNRNYSYNTGSPWYYDANEHWLFLCNQVQYVPSTTPFYAIIMFVTSLGSDVVSGRTLGLRVGYNTGGSSQSATNVYLTMKACKIQYGNYMFNEDSSGSTTVLGYAWGGMLSNSIDGPFNHNSVFGSVRWYHSKNETNIIYKLDTGGWT